MTTSRLKFQLPDQLVRQLIRDSAPCSYAPTMLVACGLPGESEDVAEMEHTASHVRTERLRPLVIPLGALSGALAGVQANMTGALSDKAGIEFSDEHLIELAEGYAVVIGSSVTAILSQLLDAGVIQLTGQQWQS